MGHRVDNAVIMAAGMSSRFAPLSYERPKALVTARGEVLIERQIRQLREAGIPKIIVIVGCKNEQFDYLKPRFGVEIIENPAYLTRNNHSSIYAARHLLGNTFICSADNYFALNPFEPEVEESYYATVYAEGPTSEWCVETDAQGYIDAVRIGGHDAWHMLGHAFWNREFSRDFCAILEAEYHRPETRGLFWEDLYIARLRRLRMKARHYAKEFISEFDTFDEFRAFDPSYWDDTRSPILKKLAARLDGAERELCDIVAVTIPGGEAVGFTFTFRSGRYRYEYQGASLVRIDAHKNEAGGNDRC